MASDRHITYYIPARIDVFRSVLGRWVAGKVSDRLQAEARFILLVAAVTLLVFAVNYGGWVWFGQDIAAAPLGATAIKYYCIQLILILSAVAGTGIGFSPAILIELDEQALILSRGQSNAVSIGIRDILSVRSMDVQLFHRTLRRHESVEVYLNRVFRSILLVKTRDQILALGLEESDLIDLTSRIEKLRSGSHHLRRVNVA